MSRFLRLITIFNSLLQTIFFIALLINSPTNIARDLVSDGLPLLDRLNKTRDPKFLRSVYAISTTQVGAVVRLTPYIATLTYNSSVPVYYNDNTREPQFGTNSYRLLRSRTSAITILYSYLISTLYSFSFTLALILSTSSLYYMRSRIAIMSSFKVT